MHSRFRPFTFLASCTILTSVLMAACGSNQPTPEPTPFQPIVTIFAPTPIPTATPQPAPEPTATPTQEANSESTARLASSSSSTSSTMSPVNVNPYTGLPIDDPAALNRKPVLIKVANTAQVRPQSGLGSADVVVEHYSEGSITRFTALFLTNAPTKVGSVRSCRLIDLQLPVIFDAALVCSGTSPGVKVLMRESPAFVNNLTMISDMGRGNECASCPMYRVAGVAPHNLFASAVRAWEELDKRGNNTPSKFRSWTFDVNPPAGGKAVSSVDVGYRSGTVNWKYDASTGRWTRALQGKTQIDKNTGEPITASNIAVVFAHHQPTLIQEDVGGSKSIEIQIWGEGPLQFFRDGQKYEGRWRRPADPATLEFYDSNGNHLALKPGNTWIEMAPLFEFPVVAR